MPVHHHGIRLRRRPQAKDQRKTRGRNFLLVGIDMVLREASSHRPQSPPRLQSNPLRHEKRQRVSHRAGVQASRHECF